MDFITNHRKESEFFTKRVFAFVITLSAIQQMPIINETYYLPIRYSLYLIFSIFGIYSVFKNQGFLNNSLIKFFILTFVYSIVLSIIAKEVIFANLLVPLGFFICSFNSVFSIQYLRKLVRWYVLIVTILSVSSVFYYAQGFTISAVYNIPAKNQIGPMIAIAVMISFFSLVNKTFLIYKKKDYFLYVVTFILNFSSLLTIRNRSSILGIVVCIFMYIFLNIKLEMTLRKWFLYFITVTLFVLLFFSGVLNPIIEFMWNSVTLNYDVSSVESISAGRYGTYLDSLQFALNNPIAGAIINRVTFFGTPHNYLLYNMAYYGIFLSFPLIMLYCYLWYFSISQIFKSKKYSYNDFTFVPWLLFFALIVSQFEYTYPYGPGTSQLMMWFLLGQYLRLHFQVDNKPKTIKIK